MPLLTMPRQALLSWARVFQESLSMLHLFRATLRVSFYLRWGQPWEQHSWLSSPKKTGMRATWSDHRSWAWKQCSWSLLSEEWWCLTPCPAISHWVSVWDISCGRIGGSAGVETPCFWAVWKGGKYHCMVVDLEFCLTSKTTLFPNPATQPAKRCTGSGQMETILLIDGAA